MWMTDMLQWQKSALFVLYFVEQSDHKDQYTLDSKPFILKLIFETDKVTHVWKSDLSCHSIVFSEK